MSNIPFQNSDEFSELFGLSSHTEYFDYTPLKDCKVAFSVQRTYPSNLRFKPAKTLDGRDDSIALIKVIYCHPNEPQGKLEGGCVPVYVNIALSSRYMQRHWGHNFHDPECPTEESLKASEASVKPVDMVWKEVKFDHSRQRFLLSGGKALAGPELLDAAYAKHCATARLIGGEPIQSMVVMKRWIKGLTNKLITVSEWTLRHVFARQLREDEGIKSFLAGYEKDALVKSDKELFDFYVYKAPKPEVMLFCGLVVAGYVIKQVWGLPVHLLNGLLSSRLFPFIAFLLLGLIDDVLPRLIFQLLNGLIRFRFWLCTARMPIWSL